MTNSAIVERVARGIDPVAWAWIDKTTVADPSHIALPLTIKRQLEAARRAIDAMRGPTQEMVDAGKAVPMKFGPARNTYVAHVYEEMIHEALR